MAVAVPSYERPARERPYSYGGSGLVDILDRILDKGLVIDVWARVSLVGIELVTIEARIVVASVDVYLRYAHAMGLTPLAARPPEQRVGQAREPQHLGEAVQELTQPLQGALGQSQPARSQQAQGGNGHGATQGGQAGLADQLRSLIQQLEQGQGGQTGGQAGQAAPAARGGRG